MNESRRFFEWRVTFGNVLTIAVFLGTIAVGWGQLRAQMDYLTGTFHEHTQYDDRRFADMATKETRVARDKEVDTKLDDIKMRLARLEDFLLNEYSQRPRR